jgi:PQQ-dependent catabolism-associated CXXCW motif protein
LSLSLWLGNAHAQAPLFSAEGYRIDLYRSPTPHELRRDLVDTPALQTLLEQTPRPLLIDVYRRPWLQGRFIEDQPHENLPGSHWLANTGDGELTPQWQRLFRAHNL